MNPSKPTHGEYYKFLINKATVTPGIVAYIENLSISDDAHYGFHKVVIDQWSSSQETLFNTMAEHFTSALVPVSPFVQDEITSFWTSNLNLILKIIKYGFQFCYESVDVNIHIVFNEKTSVDFFNKYETESTIVTDVVCSRYNEKFELDLSDIQNDAQFLKKSIYFYDLNLLACFKSIMLKVGKHTRSLNLSKNNLSQPPLPILNFFMNGDLNSVNLSHNNIQNLSDVFITEFSLNTKIDKLWLEGNPLCDKLDPSEYIKRVVSKYPRIIELDGVKLNWNRAMIPFQQNFLATPDRRTKNIVEHFIMTYFTAFDKHRRPRLKHFYNFQSVLSIATQFREDRENELRHYGVFSRNICDPQRGKPEVFNKYHYSGRMNIVRLFKVMPQTIHDRGSFKVDVLMHDRRCLVLVIEGLYCELESSLHLKFRRTFTFKIETKTIQGSNYMIANDMIFLTNPTTSEIRKFKYPPNINPETPLALLNPDEDEKQVLLNIFTHVTGLKKAEAVQRLNVAEWDMRRALIKLARDAQTKEISPDALSDDSSDSAMEDH